MSEMDRGGVCHFDSVRTYHWIIHFTMVDFILQEFYLNENDFCIF